MNDPLQDKSLLEAIEMLIVWYDTKGHTAPVPELLRVQDRLAIRSYRLAEWASELKGEYNHAYFTRKISVSRKKAGLIASGSTAAKAEAEALNENAEAYKAELDGESEAYKVDLLLWQIGKVLKAMQQRIAYLRQELDETKKQDAP